MTVNVAAEEETKNLAFLIRNSGGRYPRMSAETILTSAHALLLPREDTWCVNNSNALQDLIWQLGTHEPANGKEHNIRLILNINPQQ